MPKHYKGNPATDKTLEWRIPGDVKEQKLSYDVISGQMKHLLGEVLTVLDASYHDQVQRKAAKDLIRNSFSNKINWIYELCGYPKIGDPSTLSSVNEDKVD